MNIEVYIEHRKERLKIINDEIIFYLYVCSMYFLFCVFFMVKQITLADLNCEVSLSILVLHYVIKVGVLQRNMRKLHSNHGLYTQPQVQKI